MVFNKNFIFIARILFIPLIFTGLVYTQQQTPYLGSPFAIPGIIQAEDFDNGGEGVAYHDTDSSNQGGAYRQTGVDIESHNNGAGYNVGWVAAGEWLEYTVNVSQAGTYTIEASVAYDTSGGSFRIEFNGVDKTGTMNIPNTGGLHNYTIISKTGVSLSAGQQIMRVYFITNGGNLNYINIKSEGANRPPDAPTNLLCEGQVNPAGVTDFTPDLSWSFSDPDNDTQSAYQVLVADSLSAINSNNGNMLNTGKVNSGDKFLIYNGVNLNTSTKYYWKVKVWDSGDAESSYSDVAEFTMADTKPVEVTLPSNYGVNNWRWDISTVNNYMRSANMKIMRVIVDWSKTEKTKDVYSWSDSAMMGTNIDTALDNFKTYDFYATIGIWDETPSWAIMDSKRKLSYPPNEFAQFIYDLLVHCEQRAPGRVLSVEWNELPTLAWDTTIPVTYGAEQRDPSVYFADILKATYLKVQQFNRDYNRNVLLVMDSIWTGAYHHLDELYQLGLKNYFDRINFHHYPEDASQPADPAAYCDYHFISNLKYLRYIADEWGDTEKKIWLTEYGWRQQTEQVKANYHQYIMDVCRKSGYVELIQPYLASDNSDKMALIEGSGYTRTPAYYTYQTFTQNYPSWGPQDVQPLDGIPAGKKINVLNSGFELGINDGWIGGTPDNTVKHSGKYSMKVEGSGSIQCEFYPVEAGKLYEVKAWIKIDAENYSSAMARIDVGIKDTSDYVTWKLPLNYFGIVKTDRYPNGWRRIRFPYYVPTNAKEITVRFALNGTGTMWLDDFSINGLDFTIPKISVTPSEINFPEFKHNSVQTITLNITNTGTGTLEGTVSSDKEWIKVEPSSFEGNNVNISVTIDGKILNQTTGYFSGTVTLNTNAGIREVPVSIKATCVLVKPVPYNPLNSELTFYGSGIVPYNTKISIFSLGNDLIKTLKEENGETEIKWDGKDNTGNIVNSGIYIYVYESPKEKGVGKFTLIRKR